MILTDEIFKFREEARRLWYSYLKRDADSDSSDTFRKLFLQLFEERIIRRLGLRARPIPVDWDGEPVDDYRICASPDKRLPLMVNREIPATGNWDFPVDWIPPADTPDIRPISFFDFDVSGWRSFDFYRVRIVNSPAHPQINGRDALIRCEHAELEVIES
ncbi:MAG TPA: hypothetical protein VHN12_12885 [Geobacteraceae bacterium]|nr:hypothetical protein [Geobacteraceae bacterium]